MGNLQITVSVCELPPVECPSEPVIPRGAPAEAGESDEDWETVSVFEGVVAWSGIHVGRGTLPWRQIRSHAVATQPGLTSAQAFGSIRWRRAFGCSAEQFRGAFERESQGHSVRWWIWL